MQVLFVCDSDFKSEDRSLLVQSRFAWRAVHWRFFKQDDRRLLIDAKQVLESVDLVLP